MDVLGRIQIVKKNSAAASRSVFGKGQFEDVGFMTLQTLVAGGLYEFKRRRIHTVTQTGRLRSVVEHVPKMRAAPGARDLSAAAET